MGEKKDYYYKGKIYTGIDEDNKDSEYIYGLRDNCDCDDCVYAKQFLSNHTSYPVTGTHSFKDGQDVTRLYKLEHQLRSYNPDKEEWYKPAYLEDFHTATAGKRIVSIPNPPPDELDKEAKELVNMFYQPLGYLKCGVSSNEMWEQAKKFAIIHCQLMIDYLTKMNNNPAGIQFTERINHYTTLKQKIEAL